jgi:hypothetical protein
MRVVIPEGGGAVPIPRSRAARTAAAFDEDDDVAAVALP